MTYIMKNLSPTSEMIYLSTLVSQSQQFVMDNFTFTNRLAYGANFGQVSPPAMCIHTTAKDE